MDSLVGWELFIRDSLGLTLLSALFSARHWLLYYPLAVSLALLCLFGWSLTRPMSLVERCLLYT
ncbi:hypothetical protein ACQ4LF_22975, partial [Aeromonas salmonicida]